MGIDWPEEIIHPTVYLARSATIAQGVAVETREKAAALVELWEQGLTILAAAYYPSAEYRWKLDAEKGLGLAEKDSFLFRVDLSSTALRTSQVAYLLADQGYYHQSNALSRSVSESAKRMMLVREFPIRVYRFLDSDQISDQARNLDGFAERPRKVESKDWDELEDRYVKGGREEERFLLQKATSLQSSLNDHAHASGKGRIDMLQPTADGMLDPNSHDLMPRFHLWQYSVCALDGIEALSLVLQETSQWGAQVQSWEKLRVAWFHRFLEVNNAIAVRYRADEPLETILADLKG